MKRDSTDEHEDEDEFYENETISHKEGHSSKKTVDQHASSSQKNKNRSAKKQPKKLKARGPEYNVPEDADPESMIEINDKLRSELEQLIQAVEGQIQRVRQEKEEERKQLHLREDPDADVRRKEQELKRAQLKIQTLKKEILQMKRQIDNAYDVEKTLVLENELKDQENIYNKLVSETTSLKKVEKEQNKAFAVLNQDEDANRRLDTIKEEVAKTKQEVREKTDQLRRVDAQMKTQHTQMVEMEQKCRKIKQALKNQNKRQSTPAESEDVLTEEQVKERITEIEELEALKKQEEKKYERLIRQVEARITQVEHDKNIWSIKLKEKDQEYRLNELRIKELKRQVPHKALKPLAKKNSEGQPSKKKPDAMSKMKHSVDKSKKVDKSAKGHEEDVKSPALPTKKDASSASIQADEHSPGVNKNVDQVSSPKINVKNKHKDNKDSDEEGKRKRSESPTPNEDGSTPHNNSPGSLNKGGHSRMSKESADKEGFYDNSFLNDKDEDKEGKPAKSKPFDIKPKLGKDKGSIEKDEHDDQKSEEYSDDDHVEKDANTFITRKQDDQSIVKLFNI